MRIITRLREQGFDAYLAGGCVRDALLGRQPKDFDVATNATPDAVRECFGRRRTVAFGAAFGVIGVLPDKPPQYNRDVPILPTEVATFRSDGEYSDGRRPDSVHFGSAEQDALRRDFTINGLFYDPLEHRVIDYVGGQDDLAVRVIRTIGSASDRFGEDKLRMLRAIRFATTLGMVIELETFAAIREHAADIDVVSGERVGAEMRRVLVAPNVSLGLQRLAASGLATHVLPQWYDVNQTQVASDMQSLHSGVQEASFCVSLALLLVSHSRAVKVLGELTQGWKLANDEQRPVAFALQHWQQFANADTLRWSQLQPLLVNRDCEVALQVAAARVRSDSGSTTGIDRCLEAMQWPDERLDPLPLLTGDILRRLGMEQGPIYRTIIERVRQAQLDGEITSKDDAIRLAQSIQEAG